MTDYELGLLVGILIGEGHFGGDSKQPHVVVKMNIRHKSTMDWLYTKIPGSKLYGPYSYDGRNFYQWVVRGKSLREVLIPLIENQLVMDNHVNERFNQMRRKYGL